MKTVLAVLAFVVAAASEAPSPAFGARGVYFVALPPQPPSVAKLTEEAMQQLKQQEGSESGEYHVYLPDGRLQLVKYTTAPLASYKKPSAAPSNQFSFQNNQQVNNQVAVGFNQANKQGNGQAFQRQESAAEQTATNYVASITYTDVEPIPGPIYATKDQPLQRVLRYAPAYF